MLQTNDNIMQVVYIYDYVCLYVHVFILFYNIMSNLWQVWLERHFNVTTNFRYILMSESKELQDH